MASKRMYRSKFWRLWELDKRIREGSYPNANSFAKEWEVSRKTISRDIDFLRYSLGAPISFDQKKNGYSYSDSSWSLPNVQLTEGELFQLLLAERMADQFKGTPIAKSLQTLVEKLRALLSDQISVDPVVLLDAQISFHSFPTRPISEEIWLDVFKALRESRLMEILYRGAHWPKPHPRVIEPIHLTCIANEWYLVGFDHSVEGLRNFAVARIKSIEEVGESVPRREFDPETYFANRFGRFIGQEGKQYKVAIRFSPDVAFFIEEREWHPTQKIQRHRDGSLTLRFSAPSLYEAKRWILQWGTEAEVLKPVELRNEIVNDLEGMWKMYRNE